MVSTQNLSLKVRLGELSDYEALHEVSLGLGYKPESPEATQQRLLPLLTSNQDRVWVCEVQGRIVGWLHACIMRRLASESFIEIVGLVVIPESRRLGVGKSLVEAAAVWAKDSALGLRVRCREERAQAHDFYLSMGLSLSKQQRVFQLAAEDMAKLITPAK